MVTSPTGKGVVIIGGWNDSTWKYSTILLELKGSTMEWIPLKQTLQYARVGHIAFAIPDELTSCKTRKSSDDNNSNGSKWKKIKKKMNKLRSYMK